jgi:hypothetical protein
MATRVAKRAAMSPAVAWSFASIRFASSLGTVATERPLCRRKACANVTKGPTA